MAANAFATSLPLPNWLELLAYQVKLFSKKELNHLLQIGLKEAGPIILDLGCGAGFFCETILEMCPDRKLIAIDQNRQLLDAFVERTGALSQVQIAKWHVGNEPCPINNLDQVNAVILRLVLQHVESPIDFLKTLRKQISPGTLCFIIEEDDSYFKMDPQLPAFDKIIDCWRQYGEQFRNNRTIGSSIPRIANDAGFSVQYTGMLTHSHCEVGWRNLANYFSSTLVMIHQSNPNIISQNGIQEIKDALEEYRLKHGDACYFCYPEVISAIKAD